ncbi:protein phosphatase 1 regulatory subunit 17 [Gastrophryne carolinensis]
MMSTECVSPLDISEDILDPQEQHCKLLENLSEQLRRSCDIQKKARTERNEQNPKLPRRKDTPILQNPQLVPDFSEILLKRFEEIEKQQNTKTPPVLNKEPNLLKPRRKDTPALHGSPLSSGVKFLKEDKSTIIVESEENDG